jgi:hypothetical protein
VSIKRENRQNFILLSENSCRDGELRADAQDRGFSHILSDSLFLQGEKVMLFPLERLYCRLHSHSSTSTPFRSSLEHSGTEWTSDLDWERIHLYSFLHFFMTKTTQDPQEQKQDKPVVPQKDAQPMGTKPTYDTPVK